jgi:predicted acylesterase/phospholipase RssA
MPAQWKPRQLSLSGGGVLISAQLGAIVALKEAGVLTDVRAWHGCSAGAVIAYLCALDVSPAWLRTFVEALELGPLTTPQLHCIESFMTGWGVNDGSAMIQFFHDVVETWQPGAGSWTFADFAAARPGIDLSITATNITRRCVARFSPTTTPTVRILDALRASCAIPLYFTPWQDTSGDMYSDGMFAEYFPWEYIEEKDETLVIVNSTSHFRRDVSMLRPVKSVLQYITSIITTMQRRALVGKPRHWIAVECDRAEVVDFNISKEQRLSLFEIGGARARGWIAWSQHLTDSERATPRMPGLSADPSTSSSDRPSPEIEKDSPGYRTPPRLACPSQGLRSASSRTSRRWSL